MATVPLSTSSPSSIIEEQIQNFYDTLPKGEVAHGLSVGVIDGVDSSGEPVIIKSYSGYANVQDKIPVAEDTVFEIGSVSKTFTTTMLAAAVKTGAINLGEYAQTYYHEYSPKVILPVYTDPKTGEQAQITMLDLADYTSGILDKSPTNTQGPNEYFFSLLHSYLTNGFPNGLPQKPGTVDRYVNTNFGMIAEILMQQGRFARYEEALQDLISKASLSMPNTGVITSNTPSIPNLAQGYQSNGEIEEDYALNTWPALQGAGGIYSTLDDMLYWLQFNMGLADSSYKDLLQMLHQVWFPKNSATGAGLGWFVSNLGGASMISKDGGTLASIHGLDSCRARRSGPLSCATRQWRARCRSIKGNPRSTASAWRFSRRSIAEAPAQAPVSGLYPRRVRKSCR